MKLRKQFNRKKFNKKSTKHVLWKLWNIVERNNLRFNKMKKTSHVHGSKWYDNTPQLIYRFSTIPIKIPVAGYNDGKVGSEE